MPEWRADFTRLEAWQKACDVVEAVYSLTRSFPREELYGLGGQMRRAAVSMPTNIAEGYARRHPRDKSRFYVIARSSGEELKSLLFLATRLNFVEADSFETIMGLLDHACRLSHGLIEAANTWS
jgi:four helix bundle protein